LQLEEGPATFEPAVTLEELLRQAASVGLFSYPADSPDILSLKHTVLFGIKGVAAYADHAQILGHEDDDVYHFIFKAWLPSSRPD
jgi:hydroxylamine reductase